MKKDPEYRLLVDTKSGRPACALLQAFGAEGDYRFFLGMYSELWLVAPTKGMKWVRGPESQFKAVFDFELSQMKKEKANVR